MFFLHSEKLRVGGYWCQLSGATQPGTVFAKCLRSPQGTKAIAATALVFLSQQGGKGKKRQIPSPGSKSSPRRHLHLCLLDQNCTTGAPLCKTWLENKGVGMEVGESQLVHKIWLVNFQEFYEPVVKESHYLKCSPWWLHQFIISPTV